MKGLTQNVYGKSVLKNMMKSKSKVNQGRSREEARGSKRGIFLFLVVFYGTEENGV